MPWRNTLAAGRNVQTSSAIQRYWLAEPPQHAGVSRAAGKRVHRESGYVRRRHSKNPSSASGEG
jgi:hypothetical protein